jgi:hypothetical protein
MRAGSVPLRLARWAEHIAQERVIDIGKDGFGTAVAIAEVAYRTDTPTVKLIP